MVKGELPRESVLKVDKDCHVNAKLEQQYVRQTIAILRMRDLMVESVKATRTNHGRHYYITIHPPVEAQTANELQYLLGDDAKRVDFNQARIDSGLPEWNKLFEAVGRKTKTLYLNRRIDAIRRSRHFTDFSMYIQKKSLADFAEYVDPEEDGCPYHFRCQDCLGDVCWKD